MQQFWATLHSGLFSSLARLLSLLVSSPDLLFLTGFFYMHTPEQKPTTSFLSSETVPWKVGGKCGHFKKHSSKKASVHLYHVSGSQVWMRCKCVFSNKREGAWPAASPALGWTSLFGCSQNTTPLPQLAPGPGLQPLQWRLKLEAENLFSVFWPGSLATGCQSPGEVE